MKNTPEEIYAALFRVQRDLQFLATGTDLGSGYNHLIGKLHDHADELILRVFGFDAATADDLAGTYLHPDADPELVKTIEELMAFSQMGMPGY
jgi:hypothetical protein